MMVRIPNGSYLSIENIHTVQEGPDGTLIIRLPAAVLHIDGESADALRFLLERNCAQIQTRAQYEEERANARPNAGTFKVPTEEEMKEQQERQAAAYAAVDAEWAPHPLSPELINRLRTWWRSLWR